MTDRLLIAILILGALAVVGGLLRWMAGRRVQSTMERVRLQPDPDARARIVVFSGPGCSACHTQRRIVDELVRGWPQPVTVETVDAVSDPELAGHLGIIIVPTTIVAAPDGRIIGFNGGLVETDHLMRQLRSAA